MITVFLLIVLAAAMVYARRRIKALEAQIAQATIPAGHIVVEEAAVIAEIASLKDAIYNAFDMGVKAGQRNMTVKVTKSGNIRLGEVFKGRFVCTHVYHPLKMNKPVETP